ncbi:MAG: succinate dehydrogenase cytochrome b subunit [Proteobacteria bacterium]|nr:succinate dehydrogenase cytochrome b subunit [Pseudomonadota bacterium]MCP4916393.1 succinate dehydrogenase cytochrome b subunit [Pseudomonadota bacterium]
MTWFSTLWASTIGKKIVMAVTGLILFGFVLGHMTGNLLVWAGPEAFNDYAAMLKGNPFLLWGTRLTLLAATPIHIVSAIQLVKLNAAARPQGYKKLGSSSSTFASKTMKYGGLWLLGFLVFHLLHYTVHIVEPAYSTAAYMLADQHNAYAMVLDGFGNQVLSGVYIFSMVFLCLHIDHGAWSLLQTLGFSHPKYNAMRRNAARAFAALLFIGFCSVPVGVLANLVPAVTP